MNVPQPTVYYWPISSFFCTLCWRRRNGSSISMPPSWTIHHTSMCPSVKRSPLDGKAEMFFGTSRARWAAVVSRTNSEIRCKGSGVSCIIFIKTLIYRNYYYRIYTVFTLISNLCVIWADVAGFCLLLLISKISTVWINFSFMLHWGDCLSAFPLDREVK